MTRRKKSPNISPVYLLDFAVFKGPEDWLVDYYSAQEEAWKWDVCDRENYEFTKKVFEKSGIGRLGSYLPSWLNPTTTAKLGVQPKNDLDSAAEEARIVMVSLAKDVLERAGLKAADVDVLITSSTVFSPVPSLASMVVNALGMREDVQAYNLGGMGCSNGVVSLSLVRDILQARPNCVVLFIPAEIVTSALYVGHDRARMITNALFRAGGAAALLTNRRDLRSRAKYRLLQHERVHTGESDRAFQAMSYGPDDKGLTGIALTKDIPPEAAKAIEKVLRIVTPKMLTPAQLLDFAKHFLRKKLSKGKPTTKKAGAEAGTASAGGGEDEALPQEEEKDPYAPPPRDKDEWLPDYTRCVDHFILHAGGYGVLKGIQKGMRLPSETLLPSFATLRDIGNTSSSSTWYTFAYIESVSSGVQKGEKLLQLGVGGGMKASAAVWQALRRVEDTHPAWAHLGRVPVRQQDLPRLIDETPESALAHEAKVCAEAEALRAARRLAAAEAEAEEAALAAAAASSSLVTPRADSAGEHELERAVPADVKGGAVVVAGESGGATVVEA